MSDRCSNKLMRGAFALLALCAVFFQAAVVQTHVHVAQIGAPVASSPAGFTANEGHAPAALAAHACAYCQALSATRALGATSAVTLAAPQGISLAEATPQSASLETRLLRPWQSRAPPSRL